MLQTAYSKQRKIDEADKASGFVVGMGSARRTREFAELRRRRDSWDYSHERTSISDEE